MKSSIKKILPLFLIVILSLFCFAFVGCSPTDNLGDGNNNGDNGNETPVETVCEITSFHGATIDGEKISMFVEHDIDSVSLSGKVQVSKDCTWKLYSDKLGQNEIPTKVAASSSGELLNGDNQFYILVSSNKEDKINFYELTIHRSYEVEITYWFNGEIYKTEQVFTGHTATLSDLTVEHYKLNYWQDEEQNKIENIIVWDNINLYANATYLRKTITLETNEPNVGSVSPSGDYYNGDVVEITATPFSGYEFTGWYKKDTLISDNATTHITVSNTNETYIAHFDIIDEMKNFNFYSSVNSCTIVSIIDKSVNILTIPNYVTNIHQNILNGCSNLEELNLPFLGRNINSPTPLSYLFGMESYANSTLIYTNEQNKYYCPNNLTKVSIKNGNISNFAFDGCTTLSSITLPATTVRIGYYAFRGCTALTTITIPATTTYIGNNAFRNCENLTTVYFADSENWYLHVKPSIDPQYDTKMEKFSDACEAAKILKANRGANSHYWDKNPKANW